MLTRTPLQAENQKTPDANHDRVLLASRVLAAIIVPILVAAFIILYLFPNDTGRLFAWPIKPPMSAMLLGATYLGGAYFFTRVVFTRRWHTVQLGFLPVTTFAALMGVATILHWDKFTHGSFSFELWAFLYFTLPFIIPVIWYLNQRANQGRSAAAEQPLSRGVRLAIGCVGAVMLASAAVLEIAPAVMIPLWPWTLTPLTARAMASMFALTAIVGLGVAVDGRWSSASIIFQSQGISILFFLVAIVRASDEIQWRQAGSWTFVLGLLLVIILILWAALQARRRLRQQLNPPAASLDETPASET